MSDYAPINPFSRANAAWKGQDGKATPVPVTVTAVPPPRALLYVPFPSHELPSTLWGFVAAAGKAVGCDEAYVALPMLAATASAVGCTCRIRLKNSWSEPLILWGAGIGKSGTTKSPGADHALAPVHERERLAMKKHVEDLEAYEEALEKYEAARRSRRKGEEVPSKPKRPHAAEVWTSDATTEAVGSILLHNPRGLLLAPDELDTWLGSFDAYKGGHSDGARWIQTFHARPMKVNRKGDRPILYVPRAAVCVYGTIQPGIAARRLSGEHTESGLTARVLVAYPPRRLKQWTEDDITTELSEAYSRLLKRLYSLDFEPDRPEDLVPRIFTLSGEALERFKAFYNSHALEQAELDDEALEAFWSKMEAYAARLALLIHLATWAEGSDPEPAMVIGAGAMDRAIALTKWFCHEAKRVYGVLGETAVERDMRTLLEWMKGQDGPVSARDLTHGVRLYRRNTEAANGALERVVASGEGKWEWVQDPRGGQSKRCVRLVTADTVTATPRHDPANEGCGDGDNGDKGGGQ